MADEYLLASEIRSFTYEQGTNTTFCLLFSKIKIFQVELFLLLGVQLYFRRCSIDGCSDKC